MRNLCLTIVSLFFTISIYSQNVAYKIGASGISSFTNSTNGLLPGVGISLDNRIEFRDSKFEIKNNLEVETIRKINAKYTNHTLVKLGVGGEYNLFRFGYVNRFGENWTPYVGLGLNAIYYQTGVLNNTPSNENMQETTNYIEGFTLSLKTSLGFKYKIDKRFILNAETGIEWGAEDQSGGRRFISAGHDYSIVTSVGITYSLKI